MRFDHIGVAVPNLLSGREFLRSTLSITHWTEEFVDSSIGVRVQFGKADDDSGPWYELVAPHGDRSPVSAAIKTGKNILNHVAYFVDDIAEAGAKLRQNRCFPVSEPMPAVAYRGQKVQFFISPMKFMIELIEGADPKAGEGGTAHDTRVEPASETLCLG